MQVKGFLQAFDLTIKIYYKYKYINNHNKGENMVAKVKKTLLNQTHSRPIAYAFSQTLVSSMPSKWATARADSIQEFKDCIPKIKEFVKNKIEGLYPKEDLATLSKYDLTRKESCFWFTDRDKKNDEGNIQRDERSLYANFDCEGYGRGYRYGSSGKEIGNLRIKDIIAIYFEEMVENGIDVMKYMFLTDWGKKNGDMYDYNGKRVSRWSEDFEKLEKSIKEYGDKFFVENDLALSWITPRSQESCYERAHLVTPEEYQLLYSWQDTLERVHLKWHKHRDEMKEMFKAYAELIRTSKYLEQLIAKDPAFENIRHKITGTGTALALSGVNSSLIDECIAKRQLNDTVAVVVTSKESAGV